MCIRDRSSGYRIGPFEVESALMEHPAVLECAITAVPHPERGQVVKATIVLTKGYTCLLYTSFGPLAADGNFHKE